VELDLDRKRSQSDLEWPELLERISQCAVSEGGRRRVRALCPAEDPDTALLRQVTLGEALLLLETGHPLPVRSVDAVSEAAMRAEKGGVLSGEELWKIGRVLDAALDLARFGRSHAELGPTWPGCSR
jgi:DNA mismatch repair protein MutS2